MSGIRHTLTRRRLLKVGLGFGAIALAAGGGALWLVSDRPTAPGRRALSDREARVVHAIAEAHFPPGNALGLSTNEVDVVAGADAYVAALLPQERRLFRALLTAFDHWPRLTLASTAAFSALPLAARVDELSAFADSDVPERRLIASLFRTLVGMPFFEDPRVLAAIDAEAGCAL